ncbi:hypothetical protein JT358_09910 [Micrococcales bacterium 31B]|nr:hypothetical protein [Micrococcales bacterium 31B]
MKHSQDSALDDNPTVVVPRWAAHNTAAPPHRSTDLDDEPTGVHHGPTTEPRELPPFNGGFNGSCLTRFPGTPPPAAPTQPAPEYRAHAPSATTRTPSRASAALDLNRLLNEPFAQPVGTFPVHLAPALPSANVTPLRAGQAKPSPGNGPWFLALSIAMLSASLVAAGIVVGLVFFPRATENARDLAFSVADSMEENVGNQVGNALGATESPAPSAPTSAPPTSGAAPLAVQQPATNVSASPTPTASATTPVVVPAQSAFGDTVTWPDGVTVTVGAPRAYAPSATAQLGGADPSRVFVMDCIVNNNTGSDFNVYNVVFLPSSGSHLLDLVIDPAGGVPDVPRSEIKAGGVMSFKVAVSAPPGPFTMTVGNGVSFDPVPARYQTQLP